MEQEEPINTTVFSLNLLQLIKTAQGQNGVKHGDYQRYRRHCANKLQALNKNLKFQHGRSKFVKRKLEPNTITDVRHLYIPLFNTERAWAYAMELKKEVETREDVRKRRHLVSRIAKAAAHAKELVRLVSARCDGRSVVEAEGYLGWIAGSMLVERGAWTLALGHLTRAKRIFGELSRLDGAEPEVAGLCLQQAEDLEPGIRYCNYQIERQKPGADAGAGTRGVEAAGGWQEVQARLATLASEARSAAAAHVAYLEWQGQKLPARHERVRAAVHAINERTAALPGASSSSAAMEVEGGAVSPAVEAYDALLTALGEARAQVATAQKSSTVGEGHSGFEELSALERALAGLSALRAAERAELLAKEAEARFHATLERTAAAGGPAKKAAAAAAGPTCRAEDVVRALDGALRALAELAEEGARGGGRAGEALHDDALARSERARASRAYHLAHCHLAAGRPAEAAALLTRAEERAAEARKDAQAAGGPGAQAAVARMETISRWSAIFKVVAHAEVVSARAKEREGVEERVGGLTLEQQQAQGAGSKYLLDALASWESFAGAAGGKAPRVYQVPFPMQHVPVRPIMLDTASGHLVYPALEHRVRKAEKKGGMLSSLAGWAWGSTKQ